MSTRLIPLPMLCIIMLASAPTGALAQQPYDDLEAEAEGIELDEDTEEELEQDEPEVEPAAAPVEPVAAKPVASRGYTLGVRVGGGYNSLFSPSDPAGSPTLLYGSTFSGPSLQLGAQAGLTITRPSPALAVGLDLGLLYGWMRGSGFAENADRTKRQTIVLTAHTMRLPLLLAARFDTSETIGVRAAVGPEFLLGLGSASTVTFEQIDSPAPPLATTPARHVGVLGLLGMHYRTDRFDIPLELRFTWDPQVGDSTVERFEGYQSSEEPGAYEVAFDLHIHLTSGIEWRF